MKNKFLCLALLSFTLFSCSSDDESNVNQDFVTDYSDGIFIVNEGNFGSSNSSVSYLSNDLTNVSNEIFQNVNQRNLGDVAQSIAFSDEYAFIILNNSNVIEVVNKINFVSIATITDQMSSPRYALVHNNKLYLTHMFANKVTVYNATTFDYLETINLNFQPELIVEENDRIYVSSNFYAGTSAVSIINSNTNVVENTLTLDYSINGLTSGDDVVYALATNDTETKIYTISSNNVLTTATYPIPNSRFLEYDRNNLYFTANLNIYEVIPNTSVPISLFTVQDNSWSSLYGFEVFDGKIFTSDAKAFTEDGVITIYNTSGTVLKEFRAGMGPNGFYKD